MFASHQSKDSQAQFTPEILWCILLVALGLNSRLLFTITRSETFRIPQQLLQWTYKTNSIVLWESLPSRSPLLCQDSREDSGRRVIARSQIREALIESQPQISPRVSIRLTKMLGERILQVSAPDFSMNRTITTLVIWIAKALSSNNSSRGSPLQRPMDLPLMSFIGTNNH